MQFIDKVNLKLKAGNGGNGLVAFKHEKYNPLGGPSGGDGGNGGSIIFKVDTNKSTLLDLRFSKMIKAQDGENGKPNNMYGASRDDVIVKVPLGTIVKDIDTDEIVADLNTLDSEEVICQGGKGGKGNFHFKSSRNNAPEYATLGTPGQERNVLVELKLLADVGLVGFPNAGKSTLLSSLSNARPKIANYPFTTMEPSLGIVGYRDNKSFVMADIPGIIEGAAEGKGLGLRFLRHIERNSLLLFMVPGDTDDIKHEYEILLNELAQFNPDMLDKHRVLAITKCDLLDEELIEMLRETLPQDLPCVFISAVANQGLDELKDVLWRELNAESNKLAAVMAEDTLVHRDKDMARFAEELADEGEDEDIEYVDDVEDLDDLEYIEDFEDIEDPA